MSGPDSSPTRAGSVGSGYRRATSYASLQTIGRSGTPPGDYGRRPVERRSGGRPPRGRRPRRHGGGERDAAAAPLPRTLHGEAGDDGPRRSVVARSAQPCA
ncbi:hypothetical protein TPA0910_82260 [Streptomyces hygroscopicus subsp. sporocinereus]|uniref:Uncharacterized protein n=1 Tax=Streptomyces hygroscopicus TaxID=1912 RepID=A0ABQ3UE09_STRHY|nr:hypothetical protein TPA0910_82260 [Streptomyces hygroscopicus]